MEKAFQVEGRACGGGHGEHVPAPRSLDGRRDGEEAEGGWLRPPECSFKARRLFSDPQI